MRSVVFAVLLAIAVPSLAHTSATTIRVKIEATELDKKLLLRYRPSILKVNPSKVLRVPLSHRMRPSTYFYYCGKSLVLNRLPFC